VCGDAHWRNLANTIEPSVCGGDAAFLSNYFDNLEFPTRLQQVRNSWIGINAFFFFNLF